MIDIGHGQDLQSYPIGLLYLLRFQSRRGAATVAVHWRRHDEETWPGWGFATGKCGDDSGQIITTSLFSLTGNHG